MLHIVHHYKLSQ